MHPIHHIGLHGHDDDDDDDDNNNNNADVANDVANDVDDAEQEDAKTPVRGSPNVVDMSVSYTPVSPNEPMRSPESGTVNRHLHFDEEYQYDIPTRDGNGGSGHDSRRDRSATVKVVVSNDEDALPPVEFGRPSLLRQSTPLPGTPPNLSDHELETIPSLAQLEKMSRKQLSQVSNFTIIHPLYGSVRWLEPIDLNGVDLDDVVRFGPNMIDLYPDESSKPARGTKLNKPVEMTFFNCYPVNREGVLVEDPKKIAKFEHILREKTKAFHGEFVRYDIDTGAWQFQVDCF